MRYDMDRFTAHKTEKPELLACIHCIEHSNCYSGFSCSEIYNALSKLRYYENLEEDGRFVVLPCKIGDTVFELVPEYCDRRGKDMCNEYCDGWDTNCPDYEGETDVCARKFCESMLNKIGKTVFLTREEAERVLRGD